MRLSVVPLWKGFHTTLESYSTPHTEGNFPESKTGTLCATIAAYSVLQLRQKILQIKELSLQLNFPLLIELEEADAVEEEDLSGSGLKT